MTRRKLSMDEKLGLAERAAWLEHGKRNSSWIVGWAYVRLLAPWVLIVGSVVLLVWWIARSIGSLSAPAVDPSTPVSAGPWPWVLLGLSAGMAALLSAYRWATYRGGKALIAAIVVCLALSAAAILWARAAS